MISRVTISPLSSLCSQVQEQRLVVQTVTGEYTAGGCWQCCFTPQKISILLKMFPSINQNRPSLQQTFTGGGSDMGRWVGSMTTKIHVPQCSAHLLTVMFKMCSSSHSWYLHIFGNSKPVLFPFQELPVCGDLHIQPELYVQEFLVVLQVLCHL